MALFGTSDAGLILSQMVSPPASQTDGVTAQIQQAERFQGRECRSGKHMGRLEAPEHVGLLGHDPGPGGLLVGANYQPAAKQPATASQRST
jgi:hypothetical protein